MTTGDPVSALFGLSSAAASLVRSGPGSPSEADAFSYLFSLPNRVYA